MPSTQPYTPSYDFNADTSGTSLINLAALQSQLVDIGAWATELSAALALVIRDDDTLVDSIVRLRNLHPEVQTLLESIAEGSVATQALDYHYPVRLVSDANIAALNGHATIDDVVAVTGDEILLVGQTNAAENGPWVVDTAGDWTRRSDMPTASDSGDGWGVCVLEGTAWAGSAWMINLPGVVDTDDLGFTCIIEPMASAVGRALLTAATALAARTAISATGKQTHTITADSVTKSFTFTNGLATASVATRLADAGGNEVAADITVTAGSVVVVFVEAPTSNLTLTVIG